MKFLTHVLLMISLLATAVTRAQESKPASKPSSEQDIDTLKIDTNPVLDSGDWRQWPADERTVKETPFESCLR